MPKQIEMNVKSITDLDPADCDGTAVDCVGMVAAPAFGPVAVLAMHSVAVTVAAAAY